MARKEIDGCTEAARTTIHRAIKKLVEEGILCEVQIDSKAKCYYFTERFAEDNGYGVRDESYIGEDCGVDLQMDHVKRFLVHLDRELDAGRELDWKVLKKVPGHSIALAQLGGREAAMAALSQRREAFGKMKDGFLIRSVQLGGIKTPQKEEVRMCETSLLLIAGKFEAFVEGLGKRGLLKHMDKNELDAVARLEESQKILLHCNGKIYLARLKNGKLNMHETIDGSSADNALRALWHKHMGLAVLFSGRRKINRDLRAAFGRAIFMAALEFDPLKLEGGGQGFGSVLKWKVGEAIREYNYETHARGMFYPGHMEKEMMHLMGECVPGEQLPPIEYLAKEAEISIETAEALLRIAYVSSMDAKAEMDDGTDGSWHSILPSDAPGPEELVEKKNLLESVSRAEKKILGERERAVLQSYSREGEKLGEIGSRLGVGRARAGQIWAESIMKLKEHFGVRLPKKDENALTEKEEEVMRLRYPKNKADALSAKEVAAKLGINCNTVYEYAVRARKKIERSKSAGLLAEEKEK
ncbi:RNA polymerase sigma factor FliA [Candidatus Anstonella stagnisolia]|nr:RNA polymerase sigma factor FliA [Candidatus Anstonella stagnisolia]